MIREFVNKIESKSLAARKILNFLRRLVYSYRSGIIILNGYWRKLGLPSPKYDVLKKYKNKHAGERCFIVATGPSITMADLELIKNEISFSMNSIILAYDKTEFRPTYYGIQDEHVWKKLIENLKEKADEQTIFYSAGLAKNYDIPNNWIPLNINGWYHLFDFYYNTGRYFADFSDDAYSIVYDGYTITYSLIQLAVYMGFKEIYLLGCDNNYSDDKTKHHFIDYGHYDPTYASAGNRMDAAYLEAKKYADKHNIKIYNSTRGGKLEIFPRRSLEEVVHSE